MFRRIMELIKEGKLFTSRLTDLELAEKLKEIEQLELDAQFLVDEKTRQISFIEEELEYKKRSSEEEIERLRIEIKTLKSNNDNDIQNAIANKQNQIRRLEKEIAEEVRKTNEIIDDLLNQRKKQIEEINKKTEEKIELIRRQGDKINKLRLEEIEEEYKTKKEKLEEKYMQYRGRYEQRKQAIDEEFEQLNNNSLERKKDGEFAYNICQYVWKYNFNSSDDYKVRIDIIRKREKEFIDNAIEKLKRNSTLLYNNSKVQGRKLEVNEFKLVLRCFSFETDTYINAIKHNNLETTRNKIIKASEQINKLASFNNKIPTEFIDMKIEELELCYECEQKIQAEKEERRRQAEILKEQAKAEKELQEKMDRLEKDETHLNNAIAELEERMNKVRAEERAEYERKIAEYEFKLSKIADDKRDIENKKANNKCGYVYVITNRGSFNTDKFVKIGVTKRLDPTIRIDELGSSGLPFKFDTHCLIFSEDAFKLENDLHKHFDDRRVNKVNMHKEFFEVSLEEVRDYIIKNIDSTIEFNMNADVWEKYLEQISE